MGVREMQKSIIFTRWFPAHICSFWKPGGSITSIKGGGSKPPKIGFFGSKMGSNGVFIGKMTFFRGFWAKGFSRAWKTVKSDLFLCIGDPASDPKLHLRRTHGGDSMLPTQFPCIQIISVSYYSFLQPSPSNLPTVFMILIRAPIRHALEKPFFRPLY
jgi:hypothetical protein